MSAGGTEPDLIIDVPALGSLAGALRRVERELDLEAHAARLDVEFGCADVELSHDRAVRTHERMLAGLASSLGVLVAVVRAAAEEFERQDAALSAALG